MAGRAWHTCALLGDATVQCFGWNMYGQLGVGDTTNRNTPTAVAALGTNVVQVAAGRALAPLSAARQHT